MTTELEKQFFDTFGIKSETVFYWCDYDNKLCECGYDCDEGCRTRKIGYPQITDRILLELICLLNTITHPDLGDVYVEKMKTTVLLEYLKMFDSDFWENEEEAKKEFIEEVQELFEEG